MRACGDETDGRNAVVHQFASQLAAGHAWIADGEVEAVGNGLVEVFVVNNIEIMTAENLFQFMCSFTIDLDIVAETILAIAGCTEQCCQGILRDGRCRP